MTSCQFKGGSQLKHFPATKSVWKDFDYVQLHSRTDFIGSKSGKIGKLSSLGKVPILKEVTAEKCNSGELNTFTTYPYFWVWLLNASWQSCIFPKFTFFKLVL